MNHRDNGLYEPSGKFYSNMDYNIKSKCVTFWDLGNKPPLLSACFVDFSCTAVTLILLERELFAL